MTDSRDPASIARPLAPLDISEVEEQAYRALLGRPAATVAELAPGLGMSTPRLQRLLNVLEAKGLATHTPQRPTRYIPAAPDLAIERLIMQRQEELERARSVIRDLQLVGESARNERGPDRFVEIISSREAERQVLDDSIRAARESVLSLVRLPVRVSRLDIPRHQDQRLQLLARDRGVRFRTVIDADFLELPGAADAVRADIQAGEEVRVTGVLPVKLVIVDTRVGLLPLDLHKADSPALLVRPSPLLDALRLLYEQIWERASPMSFPDESGSNNAEVATRLSASDELVRLLAAGLNDKVIARELGVSLRTLERRIAALMSELGVRTRFQSGWLAALRLAADNPGQIQTSGR